MTNTKEKLLILADDLTGALDSGVQLAQKGYRVSIRTDCKVIFEDSADVLVVDTETRHISGESAYKIIYDLVTEAINAGIVRIYKKTDSGLRGNVGAELTAVLDATKESRIAFVPAWPKMGRTTKNGIHYVNGKPLAESIFASDVIDPVTESRVSDWIHTQSDVPVTHYTEEDAGSGIVVYDCITDEELTEISRHLFTGSEKYQMAAGCAGLLEKYPQSCAEHADRTKISLERKLLVLSGSMNDVTRNQLEDAEKKGAYRDHVPMEKIIRGTWTQKEIDAFASEFLRQADTPVAIIDTMSGTADTEHCTQNPAEVIACSMGKLSCSLLKHHTDRTFMIIGGDTLQGFIRELGIQVLEPVKEFASGTVLARYMFEGTSHYLITKSGGFGNTEQLTEIQKEL